MATKGSTPRKGTTSGGPALDRLAGSLDAAQEALKDFRRERFPHLDDPLRFVLIGFIGTTESAGVRAERWGEPLRSGADEVALPSGRRAAGVRRRAAKSAAARRSTG